MILAYFAVFKHREISSPGCSFDQGLEACGWTLDSSAAIPWLVTCQKDQSNFTGPLHGLGHRYDKSKLQHHIINYMHIA